LLAHYGHQTAKTFIQSIRRCQARCSNMPGSLATAQQQQRFNHLQV